MLACLEKSLSGLLQYSYYRYSALKGDLIFADEEGVPRGHP
jgi:hypothetical protein